MTQTHKAKNAMGGGGETIGGGGPNSTQQVNFAFAEPEKNAQEGGLL